MSISCIVSSNIGLISCSCSFNSCIKRLTEKDCLVYSFDDRFISLYFVMAMLAPNFEIRSRYQLVKQQSP